MDSVSGKQMDTFLDSVARQEIDIVAYQDADKQCFWEADGRLFGQCSWAGD